MYGGGGHYGGDGGGAANANSLFGGGGFMPSQSTAVPESSGGGSVSKVGPNPAQSPVCFGSAGFGPPSPDTVVGALGRLRWAGPERADAAAAHREADHGRGAGQRRQVQFRHQRRRSVHGMDFASFSGPR